MIANYNCVETILYLITYIQTDILITTRALGGVLVMPEGVVGVTMGFLSDA